MPKGARKQMTDKQMTDKQMTDKQMTDKQMTDKQETVYENTKLIPHTLSLIEKELEDSIKHKLKTRKEIEELKKKRLAKKKSKEEDSSSDSSSSSSSEDEKPKKSIKEIIKQAREEREDIRLDEKTLFPDMKKGIIEDLKLKKYLASLLVKNVHGDSLAEFVRGQKLISEVKKAGLTKKFVKSEIPIETFIKKYIIKKLDKKIKKKESDSSSESSSSSESEPEVKPVKKKRVIGK